jgi:hypothetical protein
MRGGVLVGGIDRQRLDEGIACRRRVAQLLPQDVPQPLEELDLLRRLDRLDATHVEVHELVPLALVAVLPLQRVADRVGLERHALAWPSPSPHVSGRFALLDGVVGTDVLHAR